MTDFAESWNLSRGRFLDEINGLSDEQLRWKPYEGALCIGQMAIHVAGVELSFSTQLLDHPLSSDEARVKAAATEGVVNDNPFPYEEAEINRESVDAALLLAKSFVEPLITEPSQAVLVKQIKSALGPIITGRGALARFAFHPAYHQGQAYLYKNSPAFPKQ